MVGPIVAMVAMVIIAIGAEFLIRFNKRAREPKDWEIDIWSISALESQLEKLRTQEERQRLQAKMLEEKILKEQQGLLEEARWTLLEVGAVAPATGVVISIQKGGAVQWWHNPSPDALEDLEALGINYQSLDH